jgi:hypothetical protein
MDSEVISLLANAVMELLFRVEGEDWESPRLLDIRGQFLSRMMNTREILPALIFILPRVIRTL